MSNTTKQMTRNELEIQNRVTVKRLAKKLTAEKLSFLIGRPADYVRNIEMLVAGTYTMDDLRCVAAALQEKNFKTFFPDVADHSLVNVQLETEVIGDKCKSTCSIITGDGKTLPYITFQEEIPEAVRIIENNEYDTRIANDAVEMLIRAGYFYKSRLPVTIYHALNRFLKITLSPTYLENALNRFCDGEYQGALIRGEKGAKGICYVEA